MSEYLSKTVMKANAERIVALADAFGHLPCGDKSDRSIETLLNLSIPCARLIKTEIVTQVFDTNDGVNDNAVEDVERLCLLAVERLTEAHGNGWWTEKAKELSLYTAELPVNVQDEIDWYATEVQSIRIPGAQPGVKTAVQPAFAAQVRRQAKRYGVKATVTIATPRIAQVQVIEEVQA